RRRLHPRQPENRAARWSDHSNPGRSLYLCKKSCPRGRSVYRDFLGCITCCRGKKNTGASAQISYTYLLIRPWGKISFGRRPLLKKYKRSKEVVSAEAASSFFNLCSSIQ